MATKIEYLMTHIEGRLQDIANDMHELNQQNAQLRAENGRLDAALADTATQLKEAHSIFLSIVEEYDSAFLDDPEFFIRRIVSVAREATT